MTEGWEQGGADLVLYQICSFSCGNMGGDAELQMSRNRRIRAPYVRWCGTGERVTAPPIPICGQDPHQKTEEGSMDAIGQFVADAVLGIDTLWGGDVMCPSGTGRFIADSWFSDEPLP